MSKVVKVSQDNTRVVNNTCNVLHVQRSAAFNSGDVLSNIVAAQGMLGTGQSLPAGVNKPYGNQSGVSWLGEASSDVIACVWGKDIDGVVGTMAVQLKLRMEYLETILPGDLLFVFMDDTGDYIPDNRFAGTLVSIVVVDRVAQRTTVQNGANVDVVSVSARDLAVVLMESATVYDQAFAQIENALYTGEWIGRLFGTKKQTALSPLENILTLLLLLYDQDETGSKLAELQWKLTASSTSNSVAQLISMLDVTTYVQNPMQFYALAEPPGIIQAGNIWSLLESYSNPLVNEFFIDVRDGSPQERQFRAAASKAATAAMTEVNAEADIANQNTLVQTVLSSKLFKPNVTKTDAGATVPDVQDGASVVALVLRQRPYFEGAFSQLPVNEVDSTECDAIEFARSSHDVMNWFRIRFPNLDVKHQEIVAGISQVPASIAKFGFRRMEAETRYMFTSSDMSNTFSKGNTKADFGDVFRSYLTYLTAWYSQNEFWYAGQITMRLKPKIRIGTRLRLNRVGTQYDFYVTSVQHSFSANVGASRTTVTLTRGRVVNGSATVPTPQIATFKHDGLEVTDGAPE